MLKEQDFGEYISIFLSENAKLNLISKNDEKFLFEKHICDSLSIKLFLDKYKITKGSILDIGCGGGFPCLPIAIKYPEFSVTGIDSIRKKIDSVQRMADALNLKNLKLINGRVEKLEKCKYDIVVSRAVADLSKLIGYAMPVMKKNGYFIAYKSNKSNEEIENAKHILKANNAFVKDIIEYELKLLKETYYRNLIVVQFKH